MKHSIENIYIQLGQYDRYAIFEFYVFSEAYKTYGFTVYGNILYNPSERIALEQLVELGGNTNTDGLIFLGGTLKDKIICQKLKNQGFWAHDVSRLSTIDFEPVKKNYGSKEIKKIPNTIPIDVDFSDSDGINLELMMYELRIKDEKATPLIKYEYDKYLAMKYVVNPLLINDEYLSSRLIDPKTKNFYEETHQIILSTKRRILLFKREELSELELIKLKELLASKRTSRFKLIRNHLGISIEKLTQFAKQHREEYLELYKCIIQFQPETLLTHGSKIPVYWDFERFIHIFLRHYKPFFVETSTKGQGTIFQYKYKDIRRLIVNVLALHQSEINERLNQGLKYQRFSEHAYYYNGNYYTFEIDSVGRLLRFYPQG